LTSTTPLGYSYIDYKRYYNLLKQKKPEVHYQIEDDKTYKLIAFSKFFRDINKQYKEE